MNDENQDSTSQQDSPDTDDLDSLSDEEKSAFEKIMAEISAATTGAPEESKPAEPPETPSESAASTPLPDEPAPETSAASPADTPVDTGPGDSENLDPDQQDALDKIMAEIETKRKGETEETTEAAEAAKTDEEELSDDQQDALNQIMAEIESKRGSEKTATADPPKPTPEEQPEEQNDETPLAEDQQDALNKIMAEIEAKKSRGDTSEAPSPDPVPMAESEVSQSDAESDTAGETAAPGKEQPAAEDETQSLSMDEFSDELSNLLAANTNDVTPAEPPHQTKATDTDQHLDKSPSPGHGEPADEKVDATPQNAADLVLHEITANPGADSAYPKRTKSNARPNRGIKVWIGRILLALLGLVCLFTMGLGGYFGYTKIRQWQHPDAQLSAAPTPSPPTAAPTIGSNTEPDAESVVPVKPAILSAEPGPLQIPDASTTTMVPEDAWRNELAPHQKQIQYKIAEIQSLKVYYRSGIDADVKKIEPLIAGTSPSLQEALADKHIDLAVRSIQRRSTYIAKLDITLTELTAIAEELLYLERRTQLYDALSLGISGLPNAALRKEIKHALDSYQSYIDQLSIDEIQVPTPNLKSVWEQILIQIDAKTDRISQTASQNKAIGNEICTGDYDRKFLLTALSPDTARCLIKWNGKDLYLNGLIELSPEVAKILAQWPGEWLSLNGLKSLSAETARSLAQWPGKRLSLNGLTILAPEATTNLSLWQGNQLEMVGLQSIGPWENYGTRLFLSESLRRRLQIQ